MNFIELGKSLEIYIMSILNLKLLGRLESIRKVDNCPWGAPQAFMNTMLFLYKSNSFGKSVSSIISANPLCYLVYISPYVDVSEATKYYKILVWGGKDSEAVGLTRP